MSMLRNILSHIGCLQIRTLGAFFKLFPYTPFQIVGETFQDKEYLKAVWDFKQKAHIFPFNLRPKNLMENKALLRKVHETFNTIVDAKEAAATKKDATAELSAEEEEILEFLLGQGDVYGPDLAKASTKANRGTIYVILDRMEEKGYIESREELGENCLCTRRRYKMTRDGVHTLLDFKLQKQRQSGSS